jgi:hypothetical protein
LGLKIEIDFLDVDWHKINWHTMLMPIDSFDAQTRQSRELTNFDTF